MRHAILAGDGRRAPHWSPADDQLLIELSLVGTTAKEIALRLNRSTAAIEHRRADLAFTGRMPGILPRRASGPRPTNRRLRQNQQRPMPDLPARHGPRFCGDCRDTIFDGTDGDGYPTVSCRCGTRLAPVKPMGRIRLYAPEDDRDPLDDEAEHKRAQRVRAGKCRNNRGRSKGHPWGLGRKGAAA